ncbi:MAG: acyl-CoA desaturase [Burkholderia gladioli]
MQPSPPSPHESATRRQPPTLAASGGRLVQRAHAGLIVLVPTLAALYGALEIADSTVRAWQWALLASAGFLTILAITVGFHRLLTHRAFQTGSVLRAGLAILGCMAAQGPPLYWVGNHRRHHRCVDSGADPHSPLTDGERRLGRWRGFWHAHSGWTFRHDLVNSLHYCPDLLQDPVVRWVGRHYFKWVGAGIALPGLLGLAFDASWHGLLDGALWGGPIRLFVTYHLTNGINSAAHLWGYQRYPTGDSSRNNWLLGIFALGEGWHNNHHADGSAALFARTWYEFDTGGVFILLLERLGLAWGVRRPCKRDHEPPSPRG